MKGTHSDADFLLKTVPVPLREGEESIFRLLVFNKPASRVIRIGKKKIPIGGGLDNNTIHLPVCADVFLMSSFMHIGQHLYNQ